MQTELIREVLSLAARLNGRVGLGRLAGVLVGSTNKTVMSLRGVTEMPGYGLLQGWRGSDVNELLHRLVEAGALRQTSPPYPAVALTVTGVGVLRGDVSVDIDDPRRLQPKLERGPVNVAATLVTPAEVERFEKLRAWRMERARERVVPAYVILPDRTLIELAARMPRTDQELLAVSGIGPAKLALFGAELRRMLNDMRDAAAVET
jgi:ATP-dependent DNA helicase RecQ